MLTSRNKEIIDYYKKNNCTKAEVIKKFKICGKRFNNILKEFDIQPNKRPTAYYLNEDFFKVIDNRQKAYWLGFILADGSISNNKGRLKITTIDKNHLEKFTKCLKSNIPVKFYKTTPNYIGSKPHYELLIVRQNFVKYICQQGINPSKTGQEIFPIIDGNLNQHLIRGIFDGDGWFSIGKDFELGICNSYDVCEKISRILNHEANVSYKIPTKNNSKKDNNLYRIRYNSKKDIIKIYEFLYKNASQLTVLDRKYNKLKKFYTTSKHLIN